MSKPPRNETLEAPQEIGRRQALKKMALLTAGGMAAGILSSSAEAAASGVSDRKSLRLDPEELGVSANTNAKKKKAKKKKAKKKAVKRKTKKKAKKKATKKKAKKKATKKHPAKKKAKKKATKKATKKHPAKKKAKKKATKKRRGPQDDNENKNNRDKDQSDPPRR